VCKESATADDVRAAMPHPVVGSAADPIALEPVDDVVVTTLVDNVYDALLTGDDSITRAPLAAGTAQAPQFEPGRTNVGLMAEHGFSALVTVRRGDTTTSVLFDTGLSPDAMVTNADRLGLDLSGVHAVVLSHGHFDPRRRPGRTRRAARYPVLADGCPPAGVDPSPTRPTRRWGRRLADTQQACADRRGLRRDRAPPAVPARRRLNPDHR
jgi:Metallo-beta-lactamase superfamily